MNSYNIGIRILTFLLFLVLIFSVFGDLSLDALIDSALATNPAIKSSAYELQGSELRRYSAFTDLLPSLDLSGRYTYLGEIPYLAFPDDLSEIMPPGMGNIEMGRHDNFEITAGLTQALFVGGAVYNANRLSANNVSMKQLSHEKAKSAVALETKTAYFGLLRALSASNSANAAYEGLSAHCDDLDRLFTEGMIEKADVLKAKVALAEIELALLSTANYIRIAKSELARLTGIDKEKLEIDTSFVFTAFIVDPNEVEKMAVEKNFDIKMLSFAVRASELAISMNKSKLLPGLALAANVHLKNPNPENQADWDRTWDLSLVSSWDVFSFGGNLADIKAARADNNALRMQKKHLEDIIRQGISAAMSALLESELKIEVATKGLEQAHESLRASKERFHAGATTNTDVLDAEAALFRAMNNRTDAIVGYNITKAKILNLMGQVR